MDDAGYDLFLDEYLLRFFRVLICQVVQLVVVVGALLVKLGFDFLWVGRFESILVLSAFNQLTKFVDILRYQ